MLDIFFSFFFFSMNKFSKFNSSRDVFEILFQCRKKLAKCQIMNQNIHISRLKYFEIVFKYNQYKTTFFCSCDQSSKHAMTSTKSSFTSHLLFETQKNQLVCSTSLQIYFILFEKSNLEILLQIDDLFHC